MIEFQVKKVSTENDHPGDQEMLYAYSLKLLSLLAAEKEISQGVFFVADTENGIPVLKFLSAYAHHSPDDDEKVIRFGEGFPGQAAKDGKILVINDIPEGYMQIESGLGKSSPVSLIIIPVKHEDKVLAVLELASFHMFTEKDEQYFVQVSRSVAEQMLSFGK